MFVNTSCMHAVFEGRGGPGLDVRVECAVAVIEKGQVQRIGIEHLLISKKIKLHLYIACRNFQSCEINDFFTHAGIAA